MTPWTAAHQAPLSMRFPRQEYWSGLPFPSPGDLLDPGIEPGSPTVQADALPSEPLRKPKNTGVGNLSLLQGIFLTQELSWDLLHCRQILYQLSYQGSPMMQLGISIRGRILRNAVGMKTDTGALYLPFKELNSTSTLLQMALFHSVFYD